jgi:hypothetical protein
MTCPRSWRYISSNTSQSGPSVWPRFLGGSESPSGKAVPAIVFEQGRADVTALPVTHVLAAEFDGVVLHCICSAPAELYCLDISPATAGFPPGPTEAESQRFSMPNHIDTFVVDASLSLRVQCNAIDLRRHHGTNDATLIRQFHLFPRIPNRCIAHEPQHERVHLGELLQALLGCFDLRPDSGLLDRCQMSPIADL